MYHHHHYNERHPNHLRGLIALAEDLEVLLAHGGLGPVVLAIFFSGTAQTFTTGKEKDKNTAAEKGVRCTTKNHEGWKRTRVQKYDRTVMDDQGSLA